MPDRNARPPGDGELPPDPWAGLAGPPPVGPPPDAPGRERHPSSWSPPPPTADDLPFTRPTHRTLWQHPATWAALLVLALVLLLGALLEPRPAPPRTPAPDAVTAVGWPSPTTG